MKGELAYLYLKSPEGFKIDTPCVIMTVVTANAI